MQGVAAGRACAVTMHFTMLSAGRPWMDLAALLQKQALAMRRATHYLASASASAAFTMRTLSASDCS